MTTWAEELLRDGGYVLLAALILLENLFPPIPSEVLLPLAGSRIPSGDMVYGFAVLAATIGSTVGALILYAIGRYGGRPLLLRYAWLLRLDEAKLDAADRTFDRYAGRVVLFGRLIPGVRSVVSVPAGLSEMPIWRFVLLTAAGSTVWNAVLIGAGWALGARWREAAGVVERAQGPVLVLLALSCAGGAALLLRRRTRRATTRS